MNWMQLIVLALAIMFLGYAIEHVMFQVADKLLQSLTEIREEIHRSQMALSERLIDLNKTLTKSN